MAHTTQALVRPVVAVVVALITGFGVQPAARAGRRIGRRHRRGRRLHHGVRQVAARLVPGEQPELRAHGRHAHHQRRIDDVETRGLPRADDPERGRHPVRRSDQAAVIETWVVGIPRGGDAGQVHAKRRVDAVVRVAGRVEREPQRLQLGHAGHREQGVRLAGQERLGPEPARPGVARLHAVGVGLGREFETLPRGEGEHGAVVQGRDGDGLGPPAEVGDQRPERVARLVVHAPPAQGGACLGSRATHGHDLGSRLQAGDPQRDRPEQTQWQRRGRAVHQVLDVVDARLARDRVVGDHPGDARLRARAPQRIRRVADGGDGVRRAAGLGFETPGVRAARRCAARRSRCPRPAG